MTFLSVPVYLSSRFRGLSEAYVSFQLTQAFTVVFVGVLVLKLSSWSPGMFSNATEMTVLSVPVYLSSRFRGLSESYVSFQLTQALTMVFVAVLVLKLSSVHM